MSDVRWDGPFAAANPKPACRILSVGGREGAMVSAVRMSRLH